jgi:hypothetical protein
METSCSKSSAQGFWTADYATGRTMTTLPPHEPNHSQVWYGRTALFEVPGFISRPPSFNPHGQLSILMPDRRGTMALANIVCTISPL